MIRSTRWYKAETLELDVASGTFDAAYFTHVLCSSRIRRWSCSRPRAR